MKPMPRTLALTGATGFIVAALLNRLLQTGWAVNALGRSLPPRWRAEEGDSRLRWFQGCLEDPESLKRLVSGVTAVVHCAGALRGATAAQFNQVNVEGVARLVQAAMELHPLPRFLCVDGERPPRPRNLYDPNLLWLYADGLEKGVDIYIPQPAHIPADIIDYLTKSMDKARSFYLRYVQGLRVSASLIERINE